MEPRQLQTADFVPLVCNAGLADAVCTSLPADFAGVVTCGVCYSMSVFGGARASKTFTMASAARLAGPAPTITAVFFIEASLSLVEGLVFAPTMSSKTTTR
eukprot:15273828-Ditylum_brightwellii.AAC.1